MVADLRVAVRASLDADQARAVADLVTSATRTDGVGPLSEHATLAATADAAPGAVHLLAMDGDRLAGYAQYQPSASAGPSAELVVDPGLRRRGVGRALVGAIGDSAGDPRLQIWAHGDLPAAREAARALGFHRARVLWQLRRSLSQPLPPKPDLPEGLALRTFEPGRDDDAWVALNAQAFSTHPEQGRWTRTDLAERIRQPWFDPSGFFLVVRGDVPAAFVWTKVDTSGGETAGEIYVVGVAPTEQRQGLGRTCTLVGLHHLRERGLAEAMLYVDESNAAAVGLYEALGFGRARADVKYSRG